MKLLVAIVLLFSITPGMSEVVEVGAHLIVHADLPRHESDADRGCSEQTCTPLAHHCGCHTTMSAQASSKVTIVITPADTTSIDPMAIASGSGRACEPPPLRPPIA